MAASRSLLDKIITSQDVIVQLRVNGNVSGIAALLLTIATAWIDTAQVGPVSTQL